MKHALLFTLLGSLPLPALALPYCHSPAELAARVPTCNENAYYAEAAVLCVTKFKRKVDQTAGQTAKTLNKAVGKMEQRQDKNFDTTGKNYQVSQNALAALITEGEARLKETDAYLDEVVFPEDVGEGGGDAESGLKATRCYQRNVSAINIVKQDFQKKLKELRLAQATAGTLQGISDMSESKVGADRTNSLTPTKIDQKGRPGAAKPKLGPGDPYHQSDISGTESVKKK